MGSVLMPMGSVLTAEGKCFGPDGKCFGAEGKRLALMGVVSAAMGTVRPPREVFRLLQGRVLAPDGFLCEIRRVSRFASLGKLC